MLKSTNWKYKYKYLDVVRKYHADQIDKRIFLLGELSWNDPIRLYITLNHLSHMFSSQTLIIKS